MDLLPTPFDVTLLSNPRGKNSTNSQINLGTTDENKNSKVLSIKISLSSGNSASIARKDILHKRHQIVKDKKITGQLWQESLILLSLQK